MLIHQLKKMKSTKQNIETTLLLIYLLATRLTIIIQQYNTLYRNLFYNITRYCYCVHCTCQSRRLREMSFIFLNNIM